MPWLDFNNRIKGDLELIVTRELINTPRILHINKYEIKIWVIEEQKLHILKCYEGLPIPTITDLRQDILDLMYLTLMSEYYICIKKLENRIIQDQEIREDLLSWSLYD